MAELGKTRGALWGGSALELQHRHPTAFPVQPTPDGGDRNHRKRKGSRERKGGHRAGGAACALPSLLRLRGSAQTPWVRPGCSASGGLQAERQKQSKALSFLTWHVGEGAPGQPGASSVLEKQSAPPGRSLSLAACTRCLLLPRRGAMLALALQGSRQSPLQVGSRGTAAGRMMQPRLASRNCVSRAPVHALVSS